MGQRWKKNNYFLDIFLVDLDLENPHQLGPHLLRASQGRVDLRTRSHRLLLTALFTDLFARKRWLRDVLLPNPINVIRYLPRQGDFFAL